MACAAVVFVPVPVLMCPAPAAQRFARFTAQRFARFTSRPFRRPPPRGPWALGDLTSMANSIQTIEGFYPGSIAYKNNNPGNLVYAGQAGATAGSGGFAVFDTYADGYQALLNQLQLDATRGLTISQEMAKWAPAGQGTNNPVAYANQVAANEGVSPDTPLTAVFASAPGQAVPVEMAAAPAPDLSSLVPDLSQVDPVWLAAGAVALAVLAYSVVS
jgi:hypothetical protein